MKRKKARLAILSFDKNRNSNEFSIKFSMFYYDGNDLSLLSHFKNITVLRVVGLNNESLKMICENNLKLKTIELGYCGSLNDFSPLSQLHNLEHLDVRFSNISQKDFKSIIENNKNLKIINVSGCQGLKDFTPLLSLSHLEEIMTIESFMYIPFWGITLLAAKNPSLIEISSRKFVADVSSYKNIIEFSDSEIPPLKDFEMFIRNNPMIKEIAITKGFNDGSDNNPNYSLLSQLNSLEAIDLLIQRYLKKILK